MSGHFQHMIVKKFPFLPFYNGNTEQLYRLRAIWAVAALMVIGFLIRCYGGIFEPYVLYFGKDDLDHLRLSGYVPPNRITTSIIDIFLSSYEDAHPPLRNIILNLILQTADNLYYIRFVAIIPGVLLIPAMFLLGLTVCHDAPVKYRYVAGVFCAFVITFMSSMIIWSIETRPYMLMLLFQVCALICLLQYSRTCSPKWLAAFFCSALLTILSDYSAVMFIGICTLLVLFISCRKPCPRYLLVAAFIGGAVLLGCMLFQYLQMQHFKTFERMTGTRTLSYITSAYINDIKDIPQNFFNVFMLLARGLSSASLQIVASFISVLYLLGLWLLYRKKSYQLLILAGGPFVVAFILAYGKLFPLGSIRHSLYLIPSIAISLLPVGRAFFQSCLCRYSKSIFVILCIAVLLSQNVFNTPSRYYQLLVSKSDWIWTTSPISERGFAEISRILTHEQDRKLIVLGNTIAPRLEYYKKLSLLQRRMACGNNIECVRSTPIDAWKKSNDTCLMTEKNLKRCINNSELANKDNQILVVVMHHQELATREFFASAGYEDPIDVRRIDAVVMMVYKGL
jgi:hypothetical protein